MNRDNRRGRVHGPGRDAGCCIQSEPLGFGLSPRGLWGLARVDSTAFVNRWRPQVPDHTGGAAPARDHFTRIPGSAPLSGERMKRSLPPGPAASTMPSETPKRILRGARLATITVSRPSRSAGS